MYSLFSARSTEEFRMIEKLMLIAKNGAESIDETALFTRVSEIIEARKIRAGAYANLEVTLMYWEVGRYVGSAILDGGRAGYGKRIVSTLAAQLMEKYGEAFELRNLRRMIQFSELFPDIEIVSPLAT
jgi:hypothetical protein